MSMGAFAMILLENALLPDEALVSDELKLVLALVAGAALWFVTTQAEHLIVQIFGAAAGMAAGSLVYNVAAHLALVAPEYLVAMLAVGGLVVYGLPVCGCAQPTPRSSLTLRRCGRWDVSPRPSRT